MKDNITGKMQEHLDHLTKPRGSLGELEEVALKMARITGKIPPAVNKKLHLVFASDHGITEEGVSLYPSEVTAQMVHNFLNGGAAINVFAKYCGFDLFCVDAGVSCDFEIGVRNNPKYLYKKCGNGVNNFAKSEAMSEKQFELAYSYGKELAAFTLEKGYGMVSLGDMGIGNTSTSAALLIAAGFDPEMIIDRGTGIDKQQLMHKANTIISGVKFHERNRPFKDSDDILRRLGGYEFVMIKSLIMELKGKSIPVVLDGFPITAAGFMAYFEDPEVSDYLFSGHLSSVRGHLPVLEKMGLRPLINLQMRLGEGTGAVLGGFIIDLACKITKEMASFKEAHVSESLQKEEDY